ncbi:MAG: VWA domain-containing protein [Acidobacteria bacterium]|nr:VWA domain-containing protein [Acidobacteriota bacterium]
MFLLVTLLASPAARGQQIVNPDATSLAESLPRDEHPVRITLRPSRIVHGDFALPVSVAPAVARATLFINGVRHSDAEGPSMVFHVRIGKYLRRLRFRVAGYDTAGNEIGSDEVVVNDPQPPFRVRALVPPVLPEEGLATIAAAVSAPPADPVREIEFFLGETSLGADGAAPFEARFDPAAFSPLPPYARVTARSKSGNESHDVRFFDGAVAERMDVLVQEIPLSVKGNLTRPLQVADLTLLDTGTPRPIDSLTRASDRPLDVILLIDSSGSMLEELPVVKRAAAGFARSILGGGNRIAVVAFRERTIWLTPFTGDIAAVERALEHLEPLGQTHLYDATIEMLYTLQTMPGRRALVVLSDGVNEGGDFELEHVAHYARYSGVPLYPIIRNGLLLKLRRIPLAKFDAERYARIAESAGASYFLIRKPAELEGVYRRIADELKNQYIIRFRTESDGRDIWHSLAVSTAIKGVTLRAPRGYFP